MQACAALWATGRSTRLNLTGAEGKDPGRRPPFGCYELPMSWWPHGGLWRHTEFLKLWGAQAISAIGNRVTRTTLPVLAVLLVGGSPVELGILSAVAVAPGALLAMLCGGVVDRNPKRPIMIVADLARASLLLTIPLAAHWGSLSMEQLYCVAGLVGAGSALFQITDNAYLPTLLEDHELVEGNAKLEGTEAVAEITGPGLAGILIQALTAPLAIVFDAVTFLVSAFFLSRIRVRESPSASPVEGEHAFSDLRAGVFAILDTPLVRPLLFASAISAVSWGFFFSLYALLLLDELGLRAATFGLIVSVGGVSALAGSALARRLSRAMGLGRAMLTCSAIAQLIALCVPLAGWAQGGLPSVVWLPVALLVLAQLSGDGFMVAHEVLAISLRQTALPRAKLARANGVFVAVHGLLLPSSALVAGAIAERVGVQAALWVGMGVGLIAPLCLLPLRHLRELPGRD